MQRSFATENVIKGITTEELQKKLRDIINPIAAANTFDQIDWAAYPLPQQVLQQERLQAVLPRPPPPPPPSPFQQAAFSQLQINETYNTNRDINKKRKSSEMSKDKTPSKSDIVPPWRQGAGAPKNVLEDRITPREVSPSLTKKEKKQRRAREEAFTVDPSKFSGDLEKRRQRFEASGPVTTVAHRPIHIATPDAHEGPVVGTCQVLEKNYFRLTSAPKPETVRPLPVLIAAFDLVRRKWSRDKNYSYVCDQFKSIRQDLTVQHIRNDFTVQVYETHARVALEKADMGEYNQCQTQLRALYSRKLDGHPTEFMAYRILYFVYTGNRSGMNDVLAQLTAADRADDAIKHALEVRSSLAFGNYYRFFQLYGECPGMGAWLMDRFVDRERLAALAQICKSSVSSPAVSGYVAADHDCRSTKPYGTTLGYLVRHLGFVGSDEIPDAHVQCRDFLGRHGAAAFIASTDREAIFHARDALVTIDALKNQAFGRVDIKGQI